MANFNFPKIGAPATRALEAAGYTDLKQLTKVTEAEIAQLHGMGPKALGILREALTFVGELKPGALQRGGDATPPATMSLAQLEALKMVLGKEVAAA